MTETIIERYQRVQERIKKACIKYDRNPKDIQLLAVSKTKPIEDIQHLAQTGQSCFGENYVQEAIEKIAVLPKLEWHFIGPIQSNKTKHIANAFDWVHSVDRLKIAQRLNDQRPEDKAPLNILLEVNIDHEASKAGFEFNAVEEAAHAIQSMPKLRLRGLMVIPKKSQQLDEQRKPFAALRTLMNQLNKKHPDWQLDTLSMGMSADLEAAIAEGATIVRIGTDIFGARP